MRRAVSTPKRRPLVEFLRHVAPPVCGSHSPCRISPPPRPGIENLHESLEEFSLCSAAILPAFFPSPLSNPCLCRSAVCCTRSLPNGSGPICSARACSRFGRARLASLALSLRLYRRTESCPKGEPSARLAAAVSGVESDCPVQSNCAEYSASHSGSRSRSDQDEESAVAFVALALVLRAAEGSPLAFGVRRYDAAFRCRGLPRH